MSEEIGFKLQVEEGNSGATVKSFKQQLKEAKNEVIEMSDRFGSLSPQAIAAAKSFGQLKEKLADVNELTSAVTDEKRFKAFAGLTSSLAGGFSAVQGAIALTSDNTKEFEKALLKVQSAAALANGLGQFADIGRQIGVAKSALMSFSAVQSAYNAATKAAAVIQKLFTGAVETTSTGFKVLRGAIIATGIGALVAVVGYAIAHFKELKEAVYKLVPGLASVSDFIGKIVDSVTDFVGITSEATREADKLRDSLTDQNDVFDKQIELMTASGSKSKEIRKIKDDQYNAEIEKLEKIAELNGSAKDEDAKKVKELKFKSALLKAEQAKEDRDEASEAAKKAKEEAKKAKEDAKQKAKAAADEAQKQFDDYYKAYEEQQQKLIDVQTEKHKFELDLRKIQGEETTALRASQIDEEIQLLKDSGGKFAEGITALEHEKVTIAAQAKADAEAAQKEIDEEAAKKAEELATEQKQIAQDIRKETEENELLALREKYDAMYAVAEGNSELMTALAESEGEAETTIKKKWLDVQRNQKAEQLNAIGGLLQGASNLFGKQTTVGKGLAIAEATIQTYLGATKAISASSSIPVIGTALGIANAALIIANGIKSVKSIVSTKVPGGSDSGGASINAPSPVSAPGVSSAPTMDGIQSTLVDQTKKLTEGKDALKAYVVESEITQKQERQKAITQTANF